MKFCVDCKWYRPAKQFNMLGAIVGFKHACLSIHTIDVVSGKPMNKNPDRERSWKDPIIACGVAGRYWEPKERQE
jgi:hypothetical protein